MLITDERYKRISSDAKILYGLMLDRMGLSAKKGWLDEQGRVFIFYPLEKACDDLNRSINTLTSLFKELTAIGLIVKKRQGQGKPDMIYVMNFASGTGRETSFTKSVNQESQLGIQNHNTCESRIAKNVNQESQALGIRNHNICDSYIRYSNTEKYKTEIIKTPDMETPGLPRAKEDESKLHSIDREELIRLSREIVSQSQADMLVDAVIEAYGLLAKEGDERIFQLLKSANTAVIADFIGELVHMDLSRVVNLTAYLKSVLADFLRKHSLRGLSPPRQELRSSYNFKEAEEWINNGGDLSNEELLVKN